MGQRRVSMGQEEMVRREDDAQYADYVKDKGEMDWQVTILSKYL